MKQPSRHRWAIILTVVVAALGIVIGSTLGYWRYASYIPPFQAQVPPMPERNGYFVATKALSRLSQVHRPPVPKRWPSGTPDELRAQLRPLEPIMAQVRAALPLEWRAPPVISVHGYDPILSGTYAKFRECTRCFAAESILRSSEGDFAGAMRASLDAMELGSKIPWGGGLIARLTGRACHAIGFSMAERIALRVPANMIPAALERVRHIRDGWPPISETLQNDRVTTLSMDTDALREIERQPFYEKLKTFRTDDSTFWGAARLLITPGGALLGDADGFYVREIAESKKPFRQRVAIPIPGDAWSRATLMSITPELMVKWEGQKTHLALLEVALAVRIYALEHGRYPTRLSDVSKKWLPAIPVDLWDQPVVYRLKNGQPVIYSLGPDGMDDGGKPADPIGLTPSSRGDLVFGKLSHRLSS